MRQVHGLQELVKHEGWQLKRTTRDPWSETRKRGPEQTEQWTCGDKSWIWSVTSLIDSRGSIHSWMITALPGTFHPMNMNKWSTSKWPVQVVRTVPQKNNRCTNTDWMPDKHKESDITVTVTELYFSLPTWSQPLSLIVYWRSYASVINDCYWKLMPPSFESEHKCMIDQPTIEHESIYHT